MPFVIAIAIGASAGFATPFGYQTNLMVYGPGGYRFTDYLARRHPARPAVHGRDRRAHAVRVSVLSVSCWLAVICSSSSIACRRFAAGDQPRRAVVA